MPHMRWRQGGMFKRVRQTTGAFGRQPCIEFLQLSGAKAGRQRLSITMLPLNVRSVSVALPSP
jgi:hypothetical protein